MICIVCKRFRTFQSQHSELIPVFEYIYSSPSHPKSWSDAGVHQPTVHRAARWTEANCLQDPCQWWKHARTVSCHRDDCHSFDYGNTVQFSHLKHKMICLTFFFSTDWCVSSSPSHSCRIMVLFDFRLKVLKDKFTRKCKLRQHLLTLMLMEAFLELHAITAL